MRSASSFVRRPLSMTPLIDVIFLLLLFFMLSSTFSRFGEIELTQATAGKVGNSASKDRAFVQLGADRLILNGAAVTLDDLLDQVKEGRVLLSLDADTSAQRLVDVLVPLRGQDGLTVMVLE